MDKFTCIHPCKQCGGLTCGAEECAKICYNERMDERYPRLTEALRLAAKGEIKPLRVVQTGYLSYLDNILRKEAK
jgi:hypothetical protein